MKPILAIAITVGTIYVYLSTVSTSASIARIILHHLRSGFVIWIPFNAESPNRFWRLYGKFEETAAWLALALAKFARKGDEGKLLVIPDTKEAIDEALKTVGDEDAKADQ